MRKKIFIFTGIIIFLFSIIINLKSYASALTSEHYKIDVNKNIVSRIRPCTPITSFQKIIRKEGNTVKVYTDSNLTTEANLNYIGTGMYAIFNDDTTNVFQLSVIGDFDGDGQATIEELQNTINNIVKLDNSEISGIIFESADITGDELIDQRDLIVVENFVEEPMNGNIWFDNVTWNNEIASIDLTTDSNYQMEYQINTYTEGNWTLVEAGIKTKNITDLNHNDKIYARLTDGIDHTEIINVTIIDNINPRATISLEDTSIGLDETINATIDFVDDETGIDINNCKWVYNTTASKIGTNSSLYTDGTFTANEATIPLTSNNEGKNYLHILATDRAGNKEEIISDAIEVINKRLLYNYVDVGDYVAYQPGTYTITVTADITGADSDQTFTSNNDIKWRVLEKDKETKSVKLISAEPIQTDDGKDFTLYGYQGFQYGYNQINSICSIYGKGPGAELITLQSGEGKYCLGHNITSEEGYIMDINKYTKYIPEKSRNQYTQLIYPSPYATEATNYTYTDDYYAYDGSGYGLNKDSNLYKVLFRDSEDTKDISYWLMNNCIGYNGVFTEFSVRNVQAGMVFYECLGEGYSYQYNQNRFSHGIRPIITLKGAVETSGQNPDNSWIVVVPTNK